MMPPLDKDNLLKPPRGTKFISWCHKMIGPEGDVEALYLHAMREISDRGYALWLLDQWNNPLSMVPRHERGEEPCEIWLAKGFQLTTELFDALEDLLGLDEL